ncbi:unnamed protein product [Phyllotreta striolata]|uniref:PPPDE domain-containing protein n=1 Tax=Phyllotreta striolata TaxID=444603 RepID=A0A9N9XUD1_PHYSR|nr:unnamed protein product [Phyllotreta striolata]
MSTSVLLLAYKSESESTFKWFFNRAIEVEAPQWHLSILVYNFEYSYTSKGITVQQTHEKPTEITYMDYTDISKNELDHYVNIILPGYGWIKENYDSIERNCQHFIHVMIDFLQVDEPIPNYCLDEKRLCQKLSPIDDHVSSKTNQNCEPNSSHKNLLQTQGQHTSHQRSPLWEPQFHHHFLSDYSSYLSQAWLHLQRNYQHLQYYCEYYTAQPMYKINVVSSSIVNEKKDYNSC